ncbi:MAG TPA: Wzz/FepE/Etk N-terminal domain-containing protein, partial [Bacteroidota bacterium]|nr:Wzz/FepE/Etk N-terminal domain-containing protein [Bacteroidota bacterium]
MKNISSNGEGEGAGFLGAVAILVKWWRFIVFNVLIVTGIAVIVSLLLPKWYKATASIMPPKDPNPFNLLGTTGSLLRGLGSLSKLAGGSQSGGSYNYFAILKSRTAMEEVVRKF